MSNSRIEVKFVGDVTSTAYLNVLPAVGDRVIIADKVYVVAEINHVFVSLDLHPEVEITLNFRGHRPR